MGTAIVGPFLWQRRCFPENPIGDPHVPSSLRLLVKDLQLRHNDQILGRLTLSAGIAASPDHGSSTTELLEAADAALYAAKRAGRDRVVAYEKKENAE